MYDSIRPGRKDGEPVVTHLRVLHYRPEGQIFFKLEFNDESKILPRRPKLNYKIETADFPQLFDSRRKITKRKYNDMQSFKPVVPRDIWPFYEQLPFAE